jgi:hypothetical protein
VDWFKPVEEAERVTDSVSLERLIQVFPQLLQHPPAIDLRPDVISVKPTQQQRERQTQALEKVSQQI